MRRRARDAAHHQTTVIGADSHPDGLVRHRDLDASESAELAALIASGRGRE
jgi:hypothetical protein